MAAPEPNARKLKILHTMTWLAPGGGADRNVWLTINGLKDEFDFHFSVGKTIARNEFAEIEGLPIHICPHLVRPIHPWKDLLAVLWYYRLMRRERFDIVHTHEAKASIITRVAAWLARVPHIIFGLHGVTFNGAHGRFKRWALITYERLTAWMNDSVVSVSQSCLDEYRAEGLLRKLPAEVVYSGIETERFVAESTLTAEERTVGRAQLGYAPDDRVLINIGRFSPGKAQHFTLRTFAEVRKTHPEAKLLLVGEGPLQPHCRQLAAELGVAEHVRFHGFAHDVPRLLALSDVHILTSLTEGLPRVVVEASLCKLPTAAFEVQGIREILTADESGFIVPQGDVPGLARAVVAVLASPENAHHVAQRAHAHAVAHWDWRTMLAHLGRIYSRIGQRVAPQSG